MSRPPKVGNTLKAILQSSINKELVITPVLEEFLATWDEVYSPKAVHRINDLLSTPPRVRSGSFSASGAGKCMRRQELSFLGAPTYTGIDNDLRMIFLNGTWTHLRWQAVLLTAGILDEVEVTQRKPSLNARCTLDGIGVVKSGRYRGRDFGFELKSRNSFVWDRQVQAGVDEETRTQADFQMLLSGFDIAVIANENKNLQTYNEWVFTRNVDRIAEMERRLHTMNNDIEKKRLRPMIPECKIRSKNGEFHKCPFGGAKGICANTGSWYG